jgi:hypothetical protein
MALPLMIPHLQNRAAVSDCKISGGDEMLFEIQRQIQNIEPSL